MSREPEMTSRVQFPSIPELKDGFEDLTKRIARKWKIKFRGRKLRPGPLGNAVLLYFMSLPEKDQVEIADAFLRRYEALLEFDEPVDDLGLSRGAASVDAGTNPIPERPATGGGEIESGGEDFPVGAKKRAPARKKRTS